VSELTRRLFLKTGLLGFSSLALGPASFWSGVPAAFASPEDAVSLFTGRVVKGVPSTCGSCSAGCGIKVFVDEGMLLGLAGNPEHPVNRGALCALGSAGMNLFDHPGRIRKPMRRVGKRGDGQWRQIEWEEALSEVAAALNRIRSGAGPGPLAVAAPGREITPFLRWFLGTLPGSILEVSDGYELSVEKELGRVFWGPARAVPDPANAGLVLNFGANPLGSTRQLVELARGWGEAGRRGPAWITLDPRLSETASRSEEWIPLRPGSDRALALAVAGLVLQNGWEDRAFLSRATDLDPGALRRALGEWTPERAADLCGVPVSTICRIAERFGTTGRSLALYGSGVTARRGGPEAARAILLLNFLKGNVGSRGGWLLHRPIPWRQPDSLPEAAEPEELAGTLFYALRRGERRIGCLLSVQANPAATDPECESTAEVLKSTERVPFHVSFSCVPNETARLADLLLPATTFLESWGLHAGYCASEGHAWLGLRQPVLEAAGGVRCPEDFLLEIARRLDGRPGEALPFKTAEGYYCSLLERTFPVQAGKGLLARLREKGFCVLGPEPCPDASAGSRVAGFDRSNHSPGARDSGVPVTIASAVAGQVRGAAGRGTEIPGAAGLLRDSTAGAEDREPEAPLEQVELLGSPAGAEDREDATGPNRGGSPVPRTPLSHLIPGMVSPPADTVAGERAAEEGKTLILFTSPTQGDEAGSCRWLEEIDHASPVWIHRRAAGELGIKEGDWVSLTGPAGRSIRTRARLTEGIHPEAVAIQARAEDRGLDDVLPRGRTGEQKPDEALVWWGDETYGENARRLVPWPGDPYQEAPGWKNTRVIIKRA